MALPSMLKGLPDMERGITRIFHRTANPAEFVQVLQALVNIAPQLGVQVGMHCTALFVVPSLLLELSTGKPTLLGSYESDHHVMASSRLGISAASMLFMEGLIWCIKTPKYTLDAICCC